LRNPGFTIVAMLTLALGIGANTTIFSVITNTLLKPLPFPDSSNLVLVWETFGKGPDNWNIVSAPNFWDFQKQSHSFESMAIFDSAGRGYNLSSSGNKQEAEQVSGVRVTSGFFPVLGVEPLLGRTFLPEEETLGKDHVVVLSYGLWQTRYGGDPSLLGQTITIDGDAFTVIGIMPKDFEWQFWGGRRKLWVPVGYTKTDFGRGDNSFYSIARLKPGVTEAQARAEMEAVGSHVREQYPKEDADMGATVSSLNDFGVNGLRTTMLTLFAAVAFVLLIACVNVANLLLARCRTAERVRHPPRPRSRRISHRTPVADRKSHACAFRRPLRTAARLRQHATPVLSRETCLAAPDASHRFYLHGQPRVRICTAHILRHRSPVRHGARVERPSQWSERASQGRRTVGKQRRQSFASRPGRVRSSARPRRPFRSRANDQEHDSSARS